MTVMLAETAADLQQTIAELRRPRGGRATAAQHLPLIGRIARLGDNFCYYKACWLAEDH